MLDLVANGEYVLNKATSDHLHAIIARDEALESGTVRGEGTVMLTPGVSLGEHGAYGESQIDLHVVVVDKRGDQPAP